MEATAKPSGYVQLAAAPVQIAQIVTAVMDAAREVIEWVDEPQRRGGYFCLVNRDGNSGAIPIFILGVGEVPSRNAFEYLAAVQEKARRLLLHPVHVLSAQSGDAGAVAVNHDVFSFAGLGRWHRK